MATRSTITRGEMTDAILRSGYLLEQRVERVFADRDYYVTANDSYLDPETGKTREIDIFAMSAEKVSRKREFIFPSVICECENNPQPVVLFVKNSQISVLHHLDAKIAGMPTQILSKKGDADGFLPVQEFLRLDKIHHYRKGSIATQYCSFTKKKQQPQEWMGLHVDEQHESFTKLISALEFYIDKYYGRYRLPRKKEVELINLEIYYPLLILQGPLYTAQLKRGRLVLRPTPHAQFRKDYYVKGRPVTYQIDVIRESFLASYLDLIDRETQGIASVIKRKRAVVRRSIDALVAKARKKKAKESFRDVFEYSPYI